MISIVFGKKFIKSAKILSPKHKEKLADLVETLSSEPYNPRLHTKPLSGALIGLYSFRITREWRVIFKFNSPNEIQLVAVGHRKDIYNKIVK